ncbi:phosphotransferase family protein [Chelatococcus reniformis]|uniref:Aminoglycoside phosphotransferase n=1 Tax=Chelatococcus reniformis TaxID=1494448 RepID=A0A916UL55_9HYPH|nr:phosphotransferase family protein [Chelatococcus reniformis]GGC77536.1 aminoglycoside phosphotransferase [Chelatococcus reniformis]
MSGAAIEGRLRNKVGRDSGGADALAYFGVLADGHAGLTFEFGVAGPGGERHYVLKIAPIGVTRRGNTDVYRQAPLLRALHRAGLPVPDVPFASAEEDELGTPYIVMERLPGRSFVVWEPHASFSREPAEVDRVWRSAVAALAGLHAFDWRTALAAWEAPRPLADEVGYWAPILEKAQEETWRAKGRRLGALLARTVPPPGPIGIVHGDYQPGNVLYRDGRLTGVIDWELASIGAQMLDLGWLAMMADRACWHADWQPVSTFGREDVAQAYAAAGGFEVSHLGWFQALACYRLGSIACLNVRLHRTGRRVDELWERFVSSIDVLFERGLELAAADAG